MGRLPRSIDPQLLYHAGSRGSNRNPIVWDHEDYQSLIGEIGRATIRNRWSLLAWCVIPNHYHLVLQDLHGGFSAGFHQINGNHSRRTNRRYERTAHLFENRPWDRELADIGRIAGALVYVYRNPVAANLCARAEDWPYSSYRETLGLRPAAPWLDVKRVRQLFGRNLDEVRECLDELVHRGHVQVSGTGLTSG
jgi:REP element-mobilizing transposase RayT